MPVKRGVKKAASSKVKKKAPQSKAATEAKREPSAGTSAAPARDGAVTHGAQPGAAAAPGAKRVEKAVTPADLQATTQRRQKLAEELQTVEKQIYDLETRYLENSHPLGNALRGYEGLLTQSQASTRRTLVRHEDRLFSNSSSTGVPH